MENSSYRKQATRYLLLLCLLTGIFTHGASLKAQDRDTAEILSLDKVLERIEQENVQLRAYRSRQLGLESQARAATSWMAPMVGAGTFMTPYPGQRLMDDRDKGMLMFQAEQAIPNAGKNKAIRNFILSQGAVEEAGRSVQLNELKAQAKLQYYQWWIALKRLELLKESAKLMQQMKEVEEVRFETNQSALANSYKAEAKLVENENMMDMQEAQIVKSRSWLNSLMNRPGMSAFEIDTSSKKAFMPSATLDTQYLAGRRADVLRMEGEIEKMELESQVMESEKKPEFKIRFDHMSPLSGMMPQAYSAMAMISIPIAPWSSKMYKEGVKAMSFNIQAMRQEREAMLVETQGMLYGMQSELSNMERKIRNMEERIVPALRRAFEANFNAYSENRLELPAVLGDWEALLMMEITVLDEREKWYEMIVRYEKELYR